MLCLTGSSDREADKENMCLPNLNKSFDCMQCIEFASHRNHNFRRKVGIYYQN